MQVQLPNYDEQPQSPKLVKPGVAAKLAATFALGDPVALYGSYLIDGPFIDQCNDQPLSWTQLVVVRRDQIGVWSKMARPNPRVAVARSEQAPPTSPAVLKGGWFNLDLRKHLNLPEEEGRYWLLVALGDHITDKMSFEIKK